MGYFATSIYGKENNITPASVKEAALVCSQLTVIMVVFREVKCNFILLRGHAW